MSAQGFFEDLLARVPRRAAQRHVSLAGYPVTFRSTSEKLLRTFEHLLPPTNSVPDLTIHAWESDDRPYWDTPHQEVFHLVSDRYSASYEGDRLYAYDRQTRQGFFWTPSIDALTASERATPFRPILHWWAHQKGLQLTHGAVVGRPNAGALLAGPGGAGKSTTALACMEYGLDFLGDDYCLIGSGDAWSVYCQAKLESWSLERLPDLKAYVLEQDTGPKKKLILDLRSKVSPYRMALRAVVVPQVWHKTEMTRTTSGAALKALAPSTLFQLPGDRQLSFRKLASIVGALPCYDLNTGPRLDTVPEMFNSLIA